MCSPFWCLTPRNKQGTFQFRPAESALVFFSRLTGRKLPAPLECSAPRESGCHGRSRALGLRLLDVDSACMRAADASANDEKLGGTGSPRSTSGYRRTYSPPRAETAITTETSRSPSPSGGQVLDHSCNIRERGLIPMPMLDEALSVLLFVRS